MRDRVFEAMRNVLLEDPEQRMIYEDIKQRLDVTEDVDNAIQIFDDENLYEPIQEAIIETQTWTTKKRVLFHAVCANLMDILFVDEPDLDDCIDYLTKTQDVITTYHETKSSKNKKTLTDTIDVVDVALRRAVNELTPAWEDFLEAV